MTYPNTPLDPAITLAGWPWHGRAERAANTGSGTGDGILTLPDGRQIPVRGIDDSGDTYLWDIGRAPPTVATDDPHEQWLGKAIVRAGDSGLTAYGGVVVGWKMHAPGHGSIKANLSVGGLAGELGHGGIGADAYNGEHGWSERAELSLAELGLPGNFGDRVFFLELADIRSDGAAALYVVTFSATAGQQGIPLARAVVEARIAMAEVDGVLLRSTSLQVVAGFDQFASSFADEDSRADWTQWIKEDDGSKVTLPSGEDPPEGQWWVHFQWTTGQRNRLLTVSHPFWAWYSGATPVVASVELEAEWHESHSGDTSSYVRDYQLDFRYDAGLVCGGHRIGIDVESAFSLQEYYGVVGSPTGRDEVAYTLSVAVNGATVHTSSSPPVAGSVQYSPVLGLSPAAVDVYSWTSNPFYPSLTFGALDPPDPGEVAIGYPIRSTPPIPFERISNKILTPRISTLTDGAVTAIEFFAAITPSGVDAGHYTSNPANLSDPGFLSGSYNPITGEVVRHTPGKISTWV